MHGGKKERSHSTHINSRVCVCVLNFSLNVCWWSVGLQATWCKYLGKEVWVRVCGCLLHLSLFCYVFLSFFVFLSLASQILSPRSLPLLILGRKEKSEGKTIKGIKCLRVEVQKGEKGVRLRACDGQGRLPMCWRIWFWTKHEGFLLVELLTDWFLSSWMNDWSGDVIVLWIVLWSIIQVGLRQN